MSTRSLILLVPCIGSAAPSQEGNLLEAFWRATAQGDLKKMQVLIDQGAPMDEVRGVFGTPLELASRLGRLDSVQFLVARGARLKREGRGGVLAAAIRHGHASVVAWLIEQGHGKPDTLEGEKRRPLHLAVDCRHLAVVRQLLGLGADVNATDSAGETPLGLALSQRQEPMVRMLLEVGKADPNAGRSALSVLAPGADWTAEDEALLRLLLQHGADVNHKRTWGTVLGDACRWGSVDRVQRLVRAGAEVQGAGADGRTPLHDALEAPGGDRVQRIQVLMEAGADPLQVDGQGISPLRQAIRSRDLEAFRLLRAFRPQAPIGAAWLLEAANSPGKLSPTAFFRGLHQDGLDLKGARNSEGQSLLHLAVEGDDDAWLTFLLDDMQVPLDVVDARGMTAFLGACRQGRLARAQELYRRGAKLDVRTRWGGNALHLALAAPDSLDLVAWLLERAPGLVRQSDLQGQSPVHVAVDENQSLEVVTRLMKAGADPHAKDKEGRSLVHLAAFHGNLEMLRFLVEVHRLPAGAVDAQGRSPLLQAANGEMRDAEACTLYLMATGGQDQVDSSGNTLLHLVARSRQVKVVRLLTQNPKIEVDGPNAEGWTPLLMGIGHREIAQLLLERGASATVRTPQGETPLGRAAALAAEGSLQRLLAIPEVRQELDRPGPHGATPLLRLLDRRWSKRGDVVACLDLLLRAGVDPHRRNREGQDAFALAATWGDPCLLVRLESGK